jgi:hypothetical protein
MRKLLISILFIGLSSCELGTDSECGPFNFRETPFHHRDTFNYNWEPTLVWLQTLPSTSKVIRWEHKDSVRIEIFVHGVTYEDWKVGFRGSRWDSSFFYSSFDSISTYERSGATIDCTPASYNLEKDVTIFAPADKDVRLSSY